MAGERRCATPRHPAGRRARHGAANHAVAQATAEKAAGGTGGWHGGVAPAATAAVQAATGRGQHCVPGITALQNGAVGGEHAALHRELVHGVQPELGGRPRATGFAQGAPLPGAGHGRSCGGG